MPPVPTKPARYRGDGSVGEEVMTEPQAPVAGSKENVSLKYAVVEGRSARTVSANLHFLMRDESPHLKEWQNQACAIKAAEEVQLRSKGCKTRPYAGRRHSSIDWWCRRSPGRQRRIKRHEVVQGRCLKAHSAYQYEYVKFLEC